MCPIYVYVHPETQEEFEELRSIKNRNKPYVSSDGVECKRKEVHTENLFIWDKNRECFKADPGYVKACRPKYIKLQNGSRVRYNPTKHC